MKQNIASNIDDRHYWLQQHMPNAHKERGIPSIMKQWLKTNWSLNRQNHFNIPQILERKYPYQIITIIDYEIRRNIQVFFTYDLNKKKLLCSETELLKESTSSGNKNIYANLKTVKNCLHIWCSIWCLNKKHTWFASTQFVVLSWEFL